MPTLAQPEPNIVLAKLQEMAADLTLSDYDRALARALAAIAITLSEEDLKREGGQEKAISPERDS